MKTGRRRFVAGVLGLGVVGVAGIGDGSPAFAQGVASIPDRRYDFGVGGDSQRSPAGFRPVGPTDRFTPEKKFGWTETEDLKARDRENPEPLKRDFVVGTKARTFRIADIMPGLYKLTVIVGDLNFGDHSTRIRVPGVEGGDDLPVLHPAAASFATLTASVRVPGNSLDITFDSPDDNWVVNALVLASAMSPEAVRVVTEKVPPPEPKSAWGPVLSWPDPTAELLAGHRKRAATVTPKSFKPTDRKRADYLKLIAGEIDFWKTQQNKETGAIIDPYRKIEWQYSTPAFAHAASALVAYAGRKDLIEPAAKALDWSARTLSERKAASGHEDFFAPMLAHAIRLLKPHVPAARSAVWENDIRRFDPFTTYRSAVGRGGNWNVVAACGEALFQKMGLRDPKSRFVEASFAGQGAEFGTPYGLYLEGPMPYDHFPRLWAADIIARGYTGPYYRELREILRRGAITSLFMQSPSGELPGGGRSAHHQWNEAEQCVTYEIYAARALADGDHELASFFKRGAHLALDSMRRWVRPSGEMQIVKNWVDPAKTHAFESYSAHSQYNLLPMSMLASAYEHAETTQQVGEKPAPADLGGFVFQIEPLHKIFANAGGTYVELDTTGDHHYDATGLIRIHFAGVSPQLGPSDSVLNHPSYRIPANSPHSATTGVGVAWQGSEGSWHHLGELDKTDIKTVTLTSDESTANRVAFRVRYEGTIRGGITAIEERFVLTPGRVEVTTLLPGYSGPVRRVIPLLADDGKTQTRFDQKSETITISQPGRKGTGSETFTVVGATAVKLGEEKYPNHNGWARLAVGEYPTGAGERGITLIITGRS
jgi:hypothetical protein